MGNSYSSGDGNRNQTASTKPFLIRAINEWALDNGFTPQLLVATDNEDVRVPRQFVKDSQIVLNIHPQAVTGLELGNEYIWCSARFSGKAEEITVPVSAVLAIYARENGQGIVFQDEDIGVPPSPGSKPIPDKSMRDKKKDSKSQDTGQGSSSHLKIVR